MILLDTSVWVDHLRRADPAVVAALESGQVAIHRFVIGELACGTLSRRGELLNLLRSLPHLVHATHDEVLHFIEKQKLAGRGIGYVDAHLLASSVLDGANLWTKDRRLHQVASDLGLLT